MTRLWFILLLAPLLVAASVPIVPDSEPLDTALERAQAEQASAEADSRRLEAVAGKAKSDAEKLRTEQVAAARAMEAAEARITASDLQLRLIAASLAVRRARFQREQQPISSLLAGLAMMARRPPLLAVADQGSVDDFVKVRILLDSTLPLIRARTAALSREIGEEQRLEQQALAARRELVRSREQLAERRQRFAALEQRAFASAESAGGEALSAGDAALAAGEDVERLRGAETSTRAAWSLAAQLEALDPAPPRPVSGEGRLRGSPFLYELPATAPVVEGFGTVDQSGVKSRGLTLATSRGAAVTVPAAGIIRFAGPYRSRNGIVIIDHGGGWMSLIVNVATTVTPGERVRLGRPLGRALGPVGVELSQNGRRLSPALIAGSSRTLSNRSEGG